MQPCCSRRLLIGVCLFAVATPPAVWLWRQDRQQTLNRGLIAAIKRSDASAVDSLLAAGADANIRDTPPRHESIFTEFKNRFRPPPQDLSPSALDTALLLREPDLTISHQAFGIVKSLLRKGADPNARDSHGDTAVTLLFYCNESIDTSRVLDSLLSAGGGANLAGATGMAPLTQAIEFGHPRCVRVLLEHGANPDLSDPDNTPLMRACAFGQTSAVRALLDHGANANPGKIARHYTPLSMATMQGFTNIIVLLKSRGATQ